MPAAPDTEIGQVTAILMLLLLPAAYLLGYAVKRWPLVAAPLLVAVLLAALLPDSNSDEDAVGRILLVLFGVAVSTATAVGILAGRRRD